MMTQQEKQKFQLLMELLDMEMETYRKIDVSERSRDQYGRFQEESKPKTVESKLESDRKFKVVKVKGTYGTYLIKDRIFDANDVDILWIGGLLLVLTLVF